MTDCTVTLLIKYYSIVPLSADSDKIGYFQRLPVCLKHMDRNVVVFFVQIKASIVLRDEFVSRGFCMGVNWELKIRVTQVKTFSARTRGHYCRISFKPDVFTPRERL